MSSRDRRRKPSSLTRDDMNTDPFKGLSSNFPTMHSRFPVVPSPGYGDLSFTSSIGDDDTQSLPVTKEQRDAWRAVLQSALGKLVPDEEKGPTG